MRYFFWSTLLCLIGLVVAWMWGGAAAVVTCTLLMLLEIGFSFENAVVNAAVLRHMDPVWQRRFLTWGILIAVFGMRFLFPLLIVSFATGFPLWDMGELAFSNPAEYTRHVLDAHVQIGAFGGMFLLMVFLKFIFDEGKELHWIHVIESRQVRLGKLEAVETVIAMIILLIVQGFLDPSHRLEAMIAGSMGVVLYVLVDGIMALVSDGEAKHGAAYAGFSGFMYLQCLDASFSLDSVIGAFAISKDIVIIMLGLGVGAMYVRSITVYLVHKGTLETYRFLIHGAHYGIGILAVIMLISMVRPVPDLITGLAGIFCIALSLVSSVRYNRKTAIGHL